MSNHHGSVECNAPENVEPFEKVWKKDVLNKRIRVYQGGSCVFEITGYYKIIYQGVDKVIFEDSKECQTVIYNKGGIIIITYLESEKAKKLET